jgi:hypothetical protein
LRSYGNKPRSSKSNVFITGAENILNRNIKTPCSIKTDDDNFSVTKIYNKNLNRLRHLNEMEENIFSNMAQKDLAAKLDELIL